MKIKILSPDKSFREIELTPELEAHFNEPIQHANTILNQINSGMYAEWFEGKKDLNVIDFGANIGLVSLYMLPACKNLLTVEPTPNHYELQYQLLRGRADRGLTAYKCALSDKDGEVIFMTGHATENKITSEDGYGNGKIKVMGYPLSWYLNKFDTAIDFCKVDIEGGEMIALTESELKNAFGKVKVFFVEVHPAYNGGMDENREELIKRFTFSGYKIRVIDYQTIVAYE